MKKINIILAIAAAALTVSCEKEIDFGGKVGAPIRFGAATGYDNGPETRTEYSGRDESNRLVQSTSQYERIDWVANTDRISILCNEVPGSTKILDYKITSAEASNEKSNAQVAPVDEQFNWGTGAHYFFAMYPAPTQTGVTAGEAVLNDNGNHTVTISGKIPATQTVTLSGREYKANMNYAYMYAAKKVDSPESNVELGFKPLVTAFEFTLLADNTFPITSNLTKVQLSASTELAGNFVATIGENGFTGNPTTSNVDQTLTLDLGTGIQLSKTDPVKFTFLALPKDQTGLKLRLTFASGETRSLELKNNSGFITVDACKKVYIRSVGVVPELTYTFDADVTSVNDLVLAAGGDKNYRVKSFCSYKTIEQPVSWRAVKYSLNGGATWIDWDDNNLPPLFRGTTGDGRNARFYSSGNGSVEYSQYTATLSNNNIPQVKKWGDNDTDERGTSANPIDLSKQSIYGETRNERISANCYIVSYPGWYKIPLVYGNALNETMEDGKNTSSYTASEGPNRLTEFVRHDGSAITDPWLKNNGATVNNAIICWQDFPFIATNSAQKPSVSGDYIVFYVPANTIKQGNAVIAARNSSGTILWSWHIWCMERDRLYTRPVGTHQMFSLNLGWYDGEETLSRRDIIIRIEQDGSGLQKDLEFRQEAAGYPGGNVFYQWGRKDPMLGFKSDLSELSSTGEREFTVSPLGLQAIEETRSYSHDDWVQHIVLVHVEGSVNKQYCTGVRKTNTLATAIQNPNVFYKTEGSISVNNGAASNWEWHWDNWARYQGHWTVDQAKRDEYMASHYKRSWHNTTYVNLWDAEGSDETDHEVIKTVYDPCPVGFKMPNHSAFASLNNSNWSYGFWVRTSPTDTRGLYFPSSSMREDEKGQVRISHPVFAHTAGHGPNLSNSALPSGVFLQSNDLTHFYPQAQTSVEAMGFPVRPIAE